jgi:transposase
MMFKGGEAALARTIRKGTAMLYFAGLDVGVKSSALCVCDGDGKYLREAVTDTAPDAVAKICERYALERLCLEAGGMSDWLAAGLRRLGIKAVVVEARLARKAAETMPVKSDRADARVLSQIARTGWYREVHVKSEKAHAARTLLMARDGLVKTYKAAEAAIRGLLKRFGVRLGQVSDGRLAARVREELVTLPEEVKLGIEPLLEMAGLARQKACALKREIAARAAKDETMQRLMSVPGVGPLTAYAYAATVDDPARFKKARQLGGYLGLTPKRFQSGETDRALATSKTGDRLLRGFLYEAATSLMARKKEICGLKRWALALARRAGFRKARVALARKLAVILHAIWIDGTWFVDKAKTAIAVAA